MAPFGTGGTYANYVGLDDLDRRRAVHGANLDRLMEVKARYDPAGVLGARRR
jgi:hypothetical protein